MKDLNDKATGSTLTASEFNEIPSEIQQAITDSGQTLSSGDLTQLSKAIGGYSKANKTAAALIDPVAGKTMFIESADGGPFKAVTGAAPGTYSDNGGSYCGTVFIPAGGDGSAAWVRDSDGYYFDAAWFGAIGDNSTDNTDAIQAAIDSISLKTSNNANVPDNSTGGKIVLGEGIYVVEDDLTITSDNIALVGTGTGSWILLNSTASIIIGVWTGNKTTSTNVKQFKLEELTIASKSSYTGSVMVKIARAAQFAFKNVYILNNVIDGATTPVTTLQLSGFQWGVLNNVRCEGATQYALDLRSVVDDEGHLTVIGGAYYVGKETNSSNACLYGKRSGDGYTITHTAFYGTHFGAFTTGGSATNGIVCDASLSVFENLLLSGCMIEQPVTGISSDKANNITLERTSFYGNGITTTAIDADIAQTVYSLKGVIFSDLVDAFMATGIRYIENLKFTSVSGTYLANTNENLSYGSGRPLGAGNGFLENDGVETLTGSPTNPVLISLTGMYAAPATVQITPDYNTDWTINSISQTQISITLASLSAGRKIYWRVRV